MSFLYITPSAFPRQESVPLGHRRFHPPCATMDLSLIHIFPRAKHGPQAQVDGLAASHRDQDLVLGGVIDAGVPLGEAGNGFPQPKQSGVGSVPGAPFL